MKVLWFAVTPSMYSINNTSHNGGGWIEALEALVRFEPSVELAIAFEHSDKTFKQNKNGVIYYPISVLQTRWNRIKSRYFFKTEEKVLVSECLKIIEDFSPDLIQVFGSEWSFGLISRFTTVPVVIHIQGSIPPYYNARFPVGYNFYDLIVYNLFRPLEMIRLIIDEKNFKRRAKREELILGNCRYFMGRTEWDKSLTKLYSQKSKYFHCNEALRPPFLKTNCAWEINRNSKDLILITTISSPLYKGLDLVLKTARLIKENRDLRFQWRVYGVKDAKFHENKLKVKAAEVDVFLLGTVSAEDLKDELLKASFFIHPSYIDNSPNSLCEAQLLGLPVISTNVGGISSLIEHNVSGLLLPANDPYTMAYNILKLWQNLEFAAELGMRGREVALKRHNPKAILSDLMDCYNHIIKE